MSPIATSLLEDDLYTSTMWQAILHNYPAAEAEYRFVCRNTPEYPLAELKCDLEAELDQLCSLRFTDGELNYLAGRGFLKPDFINFLSLFRLQRKFIAVSCNGDMLEIVARGPLVHIIKFEIHVLYIVNELYTRRLANADQTLAEARRRLEQKIQFLEAQRTDLCDATTPFVFFDFGLRRRHSGAWHREVVETLLDRVPEFFRGTSNVQMAKELGITAIGTMSHAYLQAYQSFGFRLRDFQKAALEGWVQEYRGDLGIALTDVVGMDAFLSDFDLYFAKLFDGLRHDSGDPIVWGEKAIAHYEKLGIDPRTKRLVFSDGLTMQKAVEIYRHFRGRVTTGFGIGTNLTNDTPHKALNIVMKMTQCNGQPVAKLSDAVGKTLCKDETYLAYLRQVFNHVQPEVVV
jgi:nicotinate phosphoribosyltransferase